MISMLAAADKPPAVAPSRTARSVSSLSEAARRAWYTGGHDPALGVLSGAGEMLSQCTAPQGERPPAEK